jgi:sarcosine oxidase subunit alpha
MITDALVVGGGPAGLASAYEVASRGYKVTIVDEARELGGQLRAQTQLIDPMPAALSGLRGFQLANRLIQRLQSLSVEYLLAHEAIGVCADGSVGISHQENVEKIIAKSVVVATGAAESAFPFPGWTLPGVMTIGAAQMLINRERVYPGRTTLVIGSSDMALRIAQQMSEVGIRVLVVAEAAGRATAGEDRTIADFDRTGIPLLLNTNIVSASGRGKVEEVHLWESADKNREHKYQVDFLCLDGGRHPILEALAVLNCQLTYRQGLGGWVPCYSTDFESSVPGTFVAGQAAGVTGHAGIYLTGAIAGVSVVDYLEKQASPERRDIKQAYWKELESIEAVRWPEVWQARQAHIAISPRSGSLGKHNG